MDSGGIAIGSDIDLAIMDRLDNQEVIRHVKVDLAMDFADSTLPYFVDVVGYHLLQDVELKKHIDRVKVDLFCG